jgi:hypothetical protein
MSETLKVHAAAETFPMLSDAEINALAVSIVAQGLLEPIVLTAEGEVLDGRNRLLACERVNVTPTFTTFTGNPWAFSRDKNNERRHLTTGQRAASYALSLIGEGKRANGRWARGSITGDDGDTCGSASKDWAFRMAQAGVIADWSTDNDLIVAVRDGDIALDAAYKTAKSRSDKHDFEVEQERKRNEAVIAADDAELARLLSAGHNQLNLDTTRMWKAQDPDNWRGVSNLADRIIQLWTTAREKANEQLGQ